AKPQKGSFFRKIELTRHRSGRALTKRTTRDRSNVPSVSEQIRRRRARIPREELFSISRAAGGPGNPSVLRATDFSFTHGEYRMAGARRAGPSPNGERRRRCPPTRRRSLALRVSPL